ncbi:MASE1 domain-containing protein [Rhodanobacter sp. OK091]|jgi:two-component system, NarL family, sensor histidine kinase FusK|uniref:MASE1 domain-containing sensor histidine kinase n=1 Tax=Rhodanobacter sp. OK091 TaxID=1881037 RepID=UPI000915C14D|nr:MASE1 domain-containing protein [Rhodanobacter sp. OK091]SHM18483.1 two-component system, NarL family, sensor histidine kinase UhpB [Rhodanobacter sp. OK091]
MRLKSFRLPNSGPLLGAGYLLLWLLLWPTVQPFWMLPYGLRFGALLLTPMRHWGWLLGAELAATASISLAQGMPLGWVDFAIDELPELLVMAGSLWLLRRFNLHVSLHTPQDVTRLLLSVVLVVTATTAVDAALLALIHPNSPELMLRVLGEELLSHYLGILLIVPLMIMLLRTRLDQRALTSLIMDGLLVMLPSMTILLVLSEQAAPQPQFARVLSLAPVLFFAFRHGWRGASLAMLITSLGMTLVDQHLGHAPSTAAAYLFLAVAGTGALMLGSATDALRRSSERVAEQNVYLGAVNRRLDQLAHQLRDAARGNLQADENQRRHLAAELHDELGQNITAIQTHVKLAQARLRQAGMEDISTSINTILAHMRRALHRLLDDLRPAVLDEFGLLRALDEGPIRDLLNTAGMAYHTELHGDPRLLDDDTRTAIYRLAQESATNAVKHAQASEFRLRLRIGERQGIALALLDLRDNGTGLPSRLPRGGRGLQGMRDRVTSLGGQFRLRPEHAGVHLRILLRSNSSSADNRRQN